MTEPERPADEEPEAGSGEAACDLHRVCDACGALEDGTPPPACLRCGSPRAR